MAYISHAERKKTVKKLFRKMGTAFDCLRFMAVFKVCFEGSPFFESWPFRGLYSEWMLLMEQGEVYGYFIGGQCVGFISMMQYKKGLHPVTFAKNKDIGYLSHIAVLPQYRNNGIASEMLKYILARYKKMGYDIIYMRTNKVGSMSRGLAEIQGFNQIPGVEEEVTMLRTNGAVEGDKRIFLEKYF